MKARTGLSPPCADATHERAAAIGERWVWNIAMSRSLCEMVRRVPTTIDALRECCLDLVQLHGLKG